MAKKKVFSTTGNRLLVDDIMSELTLEHRAAKAGLEIVIQTNNKPRPTAGIVVGIGDDPWLWEQIVVEGVKRPRYQIGDTVYFAWSAGVGQIIEGHEFRCLEAQEVISVERVLDLPDSPEPDSPSPSPAVGD